MATAGLILPMTCGSSENMPWRSGEGGFVSLPPIAHGNGVRMLGRAIPMRRGRPKRRLGWTDCHARSHPKTGDHVSEFSRPHGTFRAIVPDVSVVIPTHNRSELLSLTLRSALRQRDVDLEVIVVDDGSVDATLRLVDGLGDSRVRMLRHEVAQGVSAARNHGILEARGRWISFLDDDDLWSPEKLALQLQALRETGRGWAYTGMVHIAIDNRVIAGQPPPTPEEAMDSVTKINLIGGPSSVIVEKVRLPSPHFDGRLLHSPDWDLWIRLARNGPPACVDRPVVGYRIHPGNASLDLEGLLAETIEIERRYGGPIDRVRYLRYLGRLSLKIGWYREALRYYRRAAKTGDASYLMRQFLPDTSEVIARLIRVKARAVGFPLPVRSGTRTLSSMEGRGAEVGG